MDSRKRDYFPTSFQREKTLKHFERRKVSDDLSRECNKKNEHSLRCTAET